MYVKSPQYNKPYTKTFFTSKQDRIHYANQLLNNDVSYECCEDLNTNSK
jgi:hypothetical protein